MFNITIDKELVIWGTSELKNKILELVKGRNVEPLKSKIEFYKNELAPYFAELSRRNPYPKVIEQVPIVMGVWIPLWSTIPFQDILQVDYTISLTKFFMTMVTMRILLAIRQDKNLLFGENLYRSYQRTI
ncbi:hypothetical protein WKK05_35205 [Nostoc sp. UHCC 0302]|uniref:hypothetical protein n=1 Tax=Nostoc sp. UHCC 0302 TaxID=3134896 RepID=UPI00311C9521